MKLKLLFLVLIVGSCQAKQSNSDVSIPVSIAQPKEVVCFVYHRFGDGRYPSTNISINDFESHLKYLIDQKYQVLTLSDAINYLQSNEPARKTAVLTIDDGYKSFLTNGLPLLKKYKLPATLFINTETVDGADYLDWNELKEVASHSVEIGNHTHSHAYFLNEDEQTRYISFSAEIKKSQTLIAENLLVTPVVFSYPYGEFDNPMKDIVRQLGFIGAVAQNSGIIYSGSDLYQCPRFPMSEAYSAFQKFKEKANMKALRVISSKPNHARIDESKRPRLTLTFNSTHLRVDQLQCFVQGSGCNIEVINADTTHYTVALQATSDITKRRRTLYTVTVPDKNGKWHWHSHLWVNEKINSPQR